MLTTTFLSKILAKMFPKKSSKNFSHNLGQSFRLRFLTMRMGSLEVMGKHFLNRYVQFEDKESTEKCLL